MTGQRSAIKPVDLATIDGSDAQHTPALTAEVRFLRGLVYSLSDNEGCDYDHHDYCQTHGLRGRPCANGQALDYLALLPNDGKPEEQP